MFYRTAASSTDMNKKVIVVEDNRGLREQLVQILGSAKDIRCVGAFGSAEEALKEVPARKPDVVLMDYVMAKLNGATACRNILAKDPNARIILVSGMPKVAELTASGAIAVLSKPVALEILEAALNTAATRSPPIRRRHPTSAAEMPQVIGSDATKQ